MILILLNERRWAIYLSFFETLNIVIFLFITTIIII